MRPKWFVIVLFFLGGFCLEILLRSTGDAGLVLVRPSNIVIMAFLSVTGYWLVNPLYLFTALLADFAQYRVVGLAALSFYLAYALVKFLNSIINLFGEAKYFFGLTVLLLASFFEQMLIQVFSGIPLVVNQLVTAGVITALYALCYFLINKFYSPNVFKR